MVCFLWRQKRNYKMPMDINDWLLARKIKRTIMQIPSKSSKGTDNPEPQMGNNSLFSLEGLIWVLSQTVCLPDLGVNTHIFLGIAVISWKTMRGRVFPFYTPSLLQLQDSLSHEYCFWSEKFPKGISSPCCSKEKVSKKVWDYF